MVLIFDISCLQLITVKFVLRYNKCSTLFSYTSVFSVLFKKGLGAVPHPRTSLPVPELLQMCRQHIITYYTITDCSTGTPLLNSRHQLTLYTAHLFTQQQAPASPVYSTPLYPAAVTSWPCIQLTYLLNNRQPLALFTAVTPLLNNRHHAGSPIYTMTIDTS